MWQVYFKVKGIIPGRVVVPGYGTLDFSKKNLSLKVCKELHDKGFPYLEMTEEGKTKYNGIKPEEAKHAQLKKKEKKAKKEANAK